MLALCCVPVFAQTEDSPRLDIPVYPGAEAMVEVTLNREDIIPMLEAALPMLTQKAGTLAEKIDPNDIADLLRDVNKIQYLQAELTEGNATSAAIADFYSKQLPVGDWNRVFYQAKPGEPAMALYMKRNMEGYYGFRIKPETSGKKPYKRIEVFALEGKIDFAKILNLAAKVYGAKVQSPGK